MRPPATLGELVEQLGKTYSPFERLKIVGRAWALLRQMTPDQRLAVAARLGLDHADEVVETIARRSGQQASPALLSMIERAQVKGIPHLPELIADLRDPGRRAERLRQGARAVLEEAGSAMAGEPPQVPWLPPEAVAPAPPTDPPPPAAAAPPPPPPPAPRAAPAPPPPPPAAPAAPAAPAEAPPPVPPPPPVRAEPRRETPPAPGESPLAGRLTAVPSLLGRFRLLRQSLQETKGMPAAALGALLETFPDGWARRRALQVLLRAGVPAALGDAFALVEMLGAERDLLWCLSTLADSREIPAADREAFLAAAGSPAARRRLERRLRE